MDNSTVMYIAVFAAVVAVIPRKPQLRKQLLKLLTMVQS